MIEGSGPLAFRLCAVIGLALLLSSCGSTTPPPRVTDLSGSTAIRVLFRSAPAERIEIRGPRFHSARRESNLRSERNWLTVEGRETLTADQLAMVSDWIDDGVFDLTSPNGRQHLSSLGPTPATTLLVERGVDEIGIGWNPDDVWLDADMQDRVDSAVRSLRKLARSFER